MAVDALTAVKMGTEYGAQAVGLKEAGRLAPGALADIVLFDMKNSMWCPRHNLVSLLAYSARSSSVDMVMVAGKALMEKGELKTLDEERILFEAQRCADRLTK